MPLLEGYWVPPLAGYCSMLLRSWWPAAPPANLLSSLLNVASSASVRGVWLVVGAGVGLVAEVRAVEAGVEGAELVLARVVGAAVVGGGSRTRGGMRGEK